MTTERDSTMMLEQVRDEMRRAHTQGFHRWADAIDAHLSRDAVVSDDEVANAWDAFHMYVDDRDASMRAALESLASRKVAVPSWNVPENPWYAAVTDACVINFIGWHEDDARKSLHELICWENLVGLDPAVSSSARDLIEKGRSEVAVPDGYVLVPVEPTAKMLDAAIDSFIGFDSEEQVDAVWKAMLAQRDGGTQ